MENRKYSSAKKEEIKKEMGKVSDELRAVSLTKMMLEERMRDLFDELEWLSDDNNDYRK